MLRQGHNSLHYCLFGSIGAGADAQSRTPLAQDLRLPTGLESSWGSLDVKSINLGLNQASLKVVLSSHFHLTLHSSLSTFSTLTIKRVLRPVCFFFKHTFVDPYCCISYLCRQSKMRFTAVFPLACAITAFVLSLFCILAGSSPGYMEDYHIITVSFLTKTPRSLPC